jgi:hypothetical protein
MTTPLTYRHKMTLFRLGDDWIEVKGTRYPLDGVTAQIQGPRDCSARRASLSPARGSATAGR